MGKCNCNEPLVEGGQGTLDEDVAPVATGSLGVVALCVLLAVCGATVTAMALMAWVGVCLWKGWWPW